MDSLLMSARGWIGSQMCGDIDISMIIIACISLMGVMTSIVGGAFIIIWFQEYRFRKSEVAIFIELYKELVGDDQAIRDVMGHLK